ncbi:hypothetical protein ACF0H5_024231 [Mactra antiquata]
MMKKTRMYSTYVNVQQCQTLYKMYHQDNVDKPIDSDCLYCYRCWYDTSLCKSIFISCQHHRLLKEDTMLINNNLYRLNHDIMALEERLRQTKAVKVDVSEALNDTLKVAPSDVRNIDTISTIDWMN